MSKETRKLSGFTYQPHPKANFAVSRRILRMVGESDADFFARLNTRKYVNGDLEKVTPAHWTPDRSEYHFGEEAKCWYCHPRNGANSPIPQMNRFRITVPTTIVYNADGTVSLSLHPDFVRLLKNAVPSDVRVTVKPPSLKEDAQALDVRAKGKTEAEVSEDIEDHKSILKKVDPVVKGAPPSEPQVEQESTDEKVLLPQSAASAKVLEESKGARKSKKGKVKDK